MEIAAAEIYSIAVLTGTTSLANVEYLTVCTGRVIAYFFGNSLSRNAIPEFFVLMGLHSPNVLPLSAELFAEKRAVRNALWSKAE